MSEPEEKIDVTDLKDTFLECPVCIEHFNQTDRRPRLLSSCLHAFCTQCLDQLLKKEGKGQVTCPICRQVERVRGKADGLPSDPMRSKLVDYVQLKRKKRVLCSECEKHEAISRCQECQCYLCKDCDYVHRNHRMTKDHLILTLDEVMKEPVKSLSKGHFCPSHPRHHIEFYCATEGKLCCVSCTVLDHRGHNLQKLEEAAEEKKGEMIMKMTEVRQLAQVLEEAKKEGVQQKKSIFDIKSKSLSDIKSMFDELRRAVDERERQMVSSLHDKSSSLLSNVKKKMSAYEQTLAIIESTDTYFTQTKEKGDDVEMLQMYPAIRRTVEGLHHKENKSDFDVEVQSMVFQKNGFEEMMPFISQLGCFYKPHLTRPPKSFIIQDGVAVAEGKLLTIKVYKTDITAMSVDAIVNAANDQLSHGGGVARAIAAKAGSSLKNEGDRIVLTKGPIPVTGLVTTTAGNLPCKKVFHAVGPRWDDYLGKQDQCLEDLCRTVLRCLCEARNQGLASIAISSISAAIFRVPEYLCARMYIRSLKSFDQAVDGGSLKEVHFVDVSDKMVNLIQAELQDKWKEPTDPDDLAQDTAFINRCLASTSA